jgi:hypothetical protein
VPVITRKLVGETKKYPACYIEGFVQPNADNWQEFFLGHQEDIADAVVEMMNPQPRKQLLSAKFFALAPDIEQEAIAPASYPTGQATLSTSEAIDVHSSIVSDAEDRMPF